MTDECGRFTTGSGNVHPGDMQLLSRTDIDCPNNSPRCEPLLLPCATQMTQLRISQRSCEILAVLRRIDSATNKMALEVGCGPQETGISFELVAI
jgi:hypothetical protein